MFSFHVKQGAKTKLFHVKHIRFWAKLTLERHFNAKAAPLGAFCATIVKTEKYTPTNMPFMRQKRAYYSTLHVKHFIEIATILRLSLLII